ncbi:TetR/AcrR family transcriptional regulator [Nocardia sp. CA-129566]|uniref:TetR/AcrR family transcriptional regulator n=1 Tax=Nocardia sp. CA-129566 TaxID=3239976 RepID=UPI003D9691A0
MARPADPGRNALLDAGAVVAERQGLHGLTVNAVVGVAGMAKGSFYQHFPSRRDYIVSLHRRYHDAITESILAAIKEIEPGADRLRLGMNAYLDACLRTRGTKAFLAQSRTESDLLDEVRARNSTMAELVEPDLAAIGRRVPAPAAELFIAMVAEIALAELYGNGPRDDLRIAAIDLVTCRCADGG